MSEPDDDEFEPCGPLRLIWSSPLYGGHQLWAEHDPNGDVWWLYTDEARSRCIGDAEDISDPHEWAFDALDDLGLIDRDMPRLK